MMPFTQPQTNVNLCGDPVHGQAKAVATIAALGRAVRSAQAAVILVEGGARAVGATSGALMLLTDARRNLKLVHGLGDTTESLRPHQRLPICARFPLADAVRSRREVWLASPEERRARYPELESEPGTYSWAVLPLMVDSVVLGAVGWGLPCPLDDLSAGDRACLRMLARAGGDAVYRTGLYDFERRARADLERLREECQRREAFLAEANAIFDSATDSISLMGRIACLSLPLLGDWCEADILDDAGRLQLVEAAHIDPGKNSALHKVRRRPTTGRPLPRELAAGKPLQQSGVRSLLRVPLRVRGHTIGVLTFGWEDGARPYQDTDVSLAMELARRCAVAHDYMRLFATAQQAAQSREDFVAATSHELRTPLSHIKGFVSTLRSADAVWEPEVREDFLAEIEREADRQSRLVENLLEMSRIDSGGLDPAARAATKPAALVAAGVDRVRGSLGDHRLEIQVADDLPLVRVDASQVERVISNLLDNAGKYSPPGKPIGVIGRVTGQVVSVRIEDQGLGIPPEHAERVFEPFFREPTGAYPAKPGTGLGLAICRRIIRSHAGRIWVEQRPGGGAAFIFTLPTAGGREG